MATKHTGLWWATVASVVVVVFFAAIYGVLITRVHLWVCEETGSIEYRTTTLGFFARQRHEASALEKYLQSVSPGDVEHRWVWLSETGHNLLGRGTFHADSSRHTYDLNAWVGSPSFADLPDEHKRMIHDVLVRTRAWTDEKKRQLYQQLLALDGMALRDFIKKSWEKVEKK